MIKLLAIALVLCGACTSEEQTSLTCDTTVMLHSTMGVPDTATASIPVPGTACVMLGNKYIPGDFYQLTATTTDSAVQLELFDAATRSSLRRGTNTVTFSPTSDPPGIPALVWVHATTSTSVSMLDLTVTAEFHVAVG